MLNNIETFVLGEICEKTSPVFSIQIPQLIYRMCTYFSLFFLFPPFFKFFFITSHIKNLGQGQSVEMNLWASRLLFYISLGLCLPLSHKTLFHYLSCRELSSYSSAYWTCQHTLVCNSSFFFVIRLPLKASSSCQTPPPSYGMTFSSWQSASELHLLLWWLKGLQRESNSQWPIEIVRGTSAMDETRTRENKDLEEDWIKGLRREPSWQVSDTKVSVNAWKCLIVS